MHTDTRHSCPHCGQGALPAAVMPNYRRHCSGCGNYFMPDATAVIPDYGARVTHERVKLFEPGPAPMEGQQFMDV